MFDIVGPNGGSCVPGSCVPTAGVVVNVVVRRMFIARRMRQSGATPVAATTTAIARPFIVGVVNDDDADVVVVAVVIVVYVVYVDMDVLFQRISVPTFVVVQHKFDTLLPSLLVVTLSSRRQLTCK